MLRRCLPLLLLAALAGCGPTKPMPSRLVEPEDSGVDKTLAGKGPPGPGKMTDPADTAKKDEKAATPPTEK
jgi:hypothetical protein